MSALKPLHRAGATGVLVLTVLLWAAPAHAVTSAPAVPVPSAASVNGHLLDVAASSKPISPWVATDLTTLESVAGVAGTVTTAETPAGATLVAARTTAGHVLLFTLPATPATWQEVDVTQLASAPLAAGTPSVAESMWFGMIRAVWPNQNADRPVRTLPLSGISVGWIAS